jgi:hypothetical protein
MNQGLIMALQTEHREVLRNIVGGIAIDVVNLNCTPSNSTLATRSIRSEEY